MNEIRKNKDEEIAIIKVTCKIPTSTLVGYIIFNLLALGLLIYTITLRINKDSVGNDVLLTINAILFVWFIIISILSILAIKKTTCTLTNKRIYGIKATGISSKSFSYRLDMIDEVEINKHLDRQQLVLKFLQGNNADANINKTIATNDKTFTIEYIENSEQVFEELSKALNSIKNDKDLMVDIEMEKIGVQDKQADAFAKIAENISTKQPNHTETKDDYISQLQRLKQLLDAGVITQQEFDEKKKALLK